MTQDSDRQIGSESENTINVYMYDNEGNQWFEKGYEGYGEFGGMDYYELLAKMNGYSEEDLEDKALLKSIRAIGKAEMRDIGIALAFDPTGKKIKTRDKGGKVLFPALVEDPRYNWKRHDFTREAENDPNQSWYQEPEYEEDYYESAVSEGLTWEGLKESLGLNEKSIGKIQKEWAKVTAIMKDTVEAWKAAEGQEKEDLLTQLKTLTTSKKQLEAELDAAVGLKDMDAELTEAEDYSDDMSFGQLERCIDYSTMIRERIQAGTSLDPWMHSQIAVAENELNSVFDAVDGDDGVVEASVNEAKTLDRDEMMKWLEGYLDFVRETEDFDGSEGGIWVSGENGDMYKGNRIFDYYNEDYKKYEFGVYKPFAKEMEKRGWYGEWYDAGTMMIWPI